MTRMSWQASYVPVLDRLLPPRYRVLSDWLPEADLPTSSAPATPPTSSPVPTTRGCSSGSAARGGLMARADRPLATFDHLVVLPLEQGPCGKTA